MKTEEIRERTSSELEALEKDLRRELWQSQFDNHTNQLDDTSKIPALRRRIARIRTIIRERQLAAGEK